MFSLSAHAHTCYLLPDHLEKPPFDRKEATGYTVVLTWPLYLVGTLIPLPGLLCFNFFLEAEISDLCVFSAEESPVSALNFQGYFPACDKYPKPGDGSCRAVHISAPLEKMRAITSSHSCVACQPWPLSPNPSEGFGGEAGERWLGWARGVGGKWF